MNVISKTKKAKKKILNEVNQKYKHRNTNIGMYLLICGYCLLSQ